MKDVYDRIKARLEELKARTRGEQGTKVWLSQQIGVDQSYMRYLDKKKFLVTKFPDIAEALGVPLEDLVGKNDEYVPISIKKSWLDVKESLYGPDPTRPKHRPAAPRARDEAPRAQQIAATLVLTLGSSSETRIDLDMLREGFELTFRGEKIGLRLE